MRDKSELVSRLAVLKQQLDRLEREILGDIAIDDTEVMATNIAIKARSKAMLAVMRIIFSIISESHDLIPRPLVLEVAQKLGIDGEQASLALEEMHKEGDIVERCPEMFVFINTR